MPKLTKVESLFDDNLSSINDVDSLREHRGHRGDGGHREVVVAMLLWHLAAAYAAAAEVVNGMFLAICGYDLLDFDACRNGDVDDIRGGTGIIEFFTLVVGLDDKTAIPSCLADVIWDLWDAWRRLSEPTPIPSQKGREIVRVVRRV